MDKIFYFGTALAVGAAMLLTGCGWQKVPQDFSFTYNWHQGSMPPPYYYQYTIEVNQNGVGKLTYIPDYPMEGQSAPPSWTHEFELSLDKMNEIYRLSAGRGLHKKKWTEWNKVGGAYSWMKIDIAGKEYEISGDANENKKAKELFSTVYNLVDEKVWNEMRAKKKAYDGNTDEDN